MLNHLTNSYQNQLLTQPSSLFKLASKPDKCLDKLIDLIRKVSEAIISANAADISSASYFRTYNAVVNHYNRTTGVSDGFYSKYYLDLTKIEKKAVTQKKLSNLKISQAENYLSKAEKMIGNKDECPDPPEGFLQHIQNLKTKVQAVKSANTNAILAIEGSTDKVKDQIDQNNQERQSKNSFFKIPLFPIPAPNGAALLEALGALWNFFKPFRGAH